MLKHKETSRIIEMAWEDRTTFDSIKDQFDLSESEVIKIMRKNMKRSSFKMWRKRVSGRKTKHKFSSPSVTPRFKSHNQK